MKGGWRFYLLPFTFTPKDVTLPLWIRPKTVEERDGLILKRRGGVPAPYILSLWDDALELEANDSGGKRTLNSRSKPACCQTGRVLS